MQGGARTATLRLALKGLQMDKELKFDPGEMVYKVERKMTE